MSDASEPVSQSKDSGIAAANVKSPAEEHRRSSSKVQLRLAVLTVSDTRTLANDTSGQLLVDRFSEAGHTIVHREIVPDEIDAIRQGVGKAQSLAADAILITGGTGVSPRDRTPEAIEPMLDMVLPGFGELFRMLSYAEIGAASMLSRLAGRGSRCSSRNWPGIVRYFFSLLKAWPRRPACARCLAERASVGQCC